MEIKRRMYSPRLNTIAQIGYHLKRGLSVDDTAHHSSVSRSYVYRMASQNSWPTNPSVTPESPREAQIVAAARVLTSTELSDAFSMSPNYMKQVLRRVDTRTRLDFV